MPWFGANDAEDVLEERASKMRMSISGSRPNLFDEGYYKYGSHRKTGQEFTTEAPYNPIEEILNAHKYATERKYLCFFQTFRYAKCIDWTLMLIGLILAIVGSGGPPFLYFMSCVTIHDITIFARCNSTVISPQGTYIPIPDYGNKALRQVGENLLIHISIGWAAFTLCKIASTFCYCLAADRQTKAIRDAYFQSFLHKDMAWFDLFATQDFGNGITNQITHLRLGIGEVIPNMVMTTFTIAIMIVMVFILHWKEGLCFIGFILVCIGILLLGNWCEGRRQVAFNKNFERAEKVVTESFVNLKVVKVYEGLEIQKSRFNQIVDKAKGEKIWIFCAAICSSAIWLCMNGATAVIFWLGPGDYVNETAEIFCRRQLDHGLLTFEKSIPSIGHIIQEMMDTAGGRALIVYFGLLYITMHGLQLPSYFQMMAKARRSAAEVFFVIDWRCRIDSSSKKGSSPKTSAVGKLAFEDVTFCYPQRPETVVLNISRLVIFEGSFVAFAGPEQSGKATILKLIPRLYDVCSGYIALDGVNLQNYNIHWLRKQMCTITEAPVIFTGTIAENIQFGNLSASVEEIQEACKRAEIHHVINSLPKGYQTVITPNTFGDALDRREKRLLCLARAYLQRSRIIIMDNPLAPEDDELEIHLLNFVEHFRDQSTVILSSTQVTSLSKRADCIYYMEGGKILESGDHIELIQSKGLYYNRLAATMNISMEARRKFESQLKAFKYSKLISNKRRQSVYASNLESDRPAEKKSTLDNMASGKLRKASMALSLSFENESKSNEARINQSGNLVDVGVLEECYYEVPRKKNPLVVNEGYIHNNFQTMGIQRLNYARPMTNFSTQLQMQETPLYTDAEVGAITSQYRTRKLSFHPGQGLRMSTLVQINEKRLYPGLFSSIDLRADKQFKRKLYHGSVSTQFNKAKLRDQLMTDRQDATSHSTRFSFAVDGKESVTTTRKARRFVEKVADTGTFHLNERLEIDNISIQSAEMEAFLNEYDENLMTVLNKNEKGYWRDLFYVNKHDWCLIIPALIASIVLGASISAQAWIIGIYFETLSNDKCGQSYRHRNVLALCLLTLGIGTISMLAAFIQEFFLSLAGYRMRQWLRKRLFGHMLSQDLTWFDENTHDVTILLSRLSVDVTAATNVPLIFYGLVVQSISNIAASISLGALKAARTDTIYLTVGAFVGMPLLISIVYFSSRLELRQVHRAHIRFRRTTDFAQEFFNNSETWFSLGAESFFIKQHKKLLDKDYRCLNWSTFGSSLINSIVQTSSWILYAVFTCVTLMTSKVQYHNDPNKNSILGKLDCRDNILQTLLGSQSLIGFILIVTELFIFGAYRVADQAGILADVNLAKVAAHKIMLILKSQPDTEVVLTREKPVKWKTANSTVYDPFGPPPEIGLTNISYLYPGKEKVNDRIAIDNVSLTIPSGSYVAIVGPPGCGKSTLCNIFLRLCNPTTGILDLNGDDCSEVAPRETRRCMSLVEYDPCLFHFTVMENIKYGNQYEAVQDSDVEEAAKDCDCHYEILGLNRDYQTLVSSMKKTAENFSLKQHISFARSLMKRPKVILVDDATLSTDPESDHDILKVLSSIRENRTLIVFSHRIDPIRDAEKIFVLWEGRIVESGVDEYLLHKKGVYYEMFMTQRVLADYMKNSPDQISTLRYNIKVPNYMDQNEAEETPNSKKLYALLKQTADQYTTPAAYSQYLDDKVKEMKAAKDRRTLALESELPRLQREKERRRSSK